jgi:retinol dehydrogenase 12
VSGDVEQICLITGASSGIGLETARGMAAQGFRVVMVGRNPERTPAAAATVRESTGNQRVEHLLADFSSLAQVRALAEAFTARHDRLDVLINNAGLWHPSREVSGDGFEDTFAVNHLAPFLLTNLLLGPLANASPSRVVVVSSRYHLKPKSLDLDDIHAVSGAYGGMAVYKQSKLCNVLFANELARRVADRGITVNSVHPGDVATGIVRDNVVLNALIRLGQYWLLKTPVQGAMTSLHVATAPELDGVSGRYYSDSREAKQSPLAGDRELATRLWDLSERLTSL